MQGIEGSSSGHRTVVQVKSRVSVQILERNLDIGPLQEQKSVIARQRCRAMICKQRLTRRPGSHCTGPDGEPSNGSPRPVD
jgi:hypothetical protein